MWSAVGEQWSLGEMVVWPRWLYGVQWSYEACGGKWLYGVHSGFMECIWGAVVMCGTVVGWGAPPCPT